MKYCRFVVEEQVCYGTVEEREGEMWIKGLAPAPEEDLAFHLAHLRGEARSVYFDPMPLSTAQLLPPVTPSKIVCVGRNYRDHAKELGNEVPAEPLLFFKPPSSLLEPGGVVQMPPAAARVDFEGELALVIGRRASKLKADAGWRSYVRGYTVANDVTARDLQNTDGQWTRSKGFDTFCPLGPWIETELDPADVLITCSVNGQMRQMASTRDMIFPVRQLVAFISSVMSLNPGDVILTGTPAGVGALGHGDEVSVEIEGLGTLTNPVRTDPRVGPTDAA